MTPFEAFLREIGVIAPKPAPAAPPATGWKPATPGQEPPF